MLTLYVTTKTFVSMSLGIEIIPHKKTEKIITPPPEKIISPLPFPRAPHHRLFFHILPSFAFILSFHFLISFLSPLSSVFFHNFTFCTFTFYISSQNGLGQCLPPPPQGRAFLPGAFGNIITSAPPLPHIPTGQWMAGQAGDKCR
jgi:hypothetical protein